MRGCVTLASSAVAGRIWRGILQSCSGEPNAVHNCGHPVDWEELSGPSEEGVEAIGLLSLGDNMWLSLWRWARGGPEHEEGGAKGLSSWRREVG